MGFYEEQKAAFAEINIIMDQAMAEKKAINVKLLIYKLTMKYACSEKKLIERLDRWLELNSAEVRNDVLVIPDVP